MDLGSWFKTRFLVLALATFYAHLVQSKAEFNLTILHTNDVHAHFDQFNAYGGRCTEKAAADHECYGGFARQVAKVQEIRNTTENVIYLNAGDFFQGTIWYTLYKENITAKYVNMLKLDVMALGNHEFDDGVPLLSSFLEKVSFPVLCCNCDFSKEDRLYGLVKKSVVLTVGNKKIGVIGYLTPETSFLGQVGNMTLTDELSSIKEEIKNMKQREKQLDVIIALGHSGLPKDIEMAKELSEVDVIVGGHSHTFTYTGTPPSTEIPEAEYPVVIEHDNGRKTLVVQDFCYGKYMGYLWVVFNDNGKIEKFGGNPILLDYTVPQDKVVLKEIEKDKAFVSVERENIVGKTQVLLKGDRTVCRMRECNMGNFLADAAVHFYLTVKKEKGWTSVPIAVLNSGGIRASIDEIINQGNITMEDVLSVLPFQNTIDIVVVSGTQLKAIMEEAVSRYDTTGKSPPGALLQVSGIRVLYDLKKEPNNRVLKLETRCGDCRVPKFLPLNETAEYSVAVPSYVVNGGDNFTTFGNAIKHINTGSLDTDIAINYLRQVSPVTSQLEDRIIFTTSRGRVNQETNVAFTILSFSFFLHLIFVNTPHFFIFFFS